ncbi:alpha/beta hydrolase [Pseudomonas stutzeri]|nr:alpha/beta hydrolase [Stutzerimonas stutzeri]
MAVWHLADYALRGVESGEGAALLLVHGSLCDHRFWSAQVPALAGRWRVLAPSLRRCFPERWDGRGGGFSIERHVADLIELVERQGESMHVLGHSRGGNVALRLAAQRPDLVRSLLLADPGGDYASGLYVASGASVPPTGGERNRFRLEALGLIRAGQVEAGLRLFVDTVSGPGIWERSSARFRHMALDNAYTLVGLVEDHPEPVGEGLLAAVRCPVLLLGGERSPQPFPAILRMLGHCLSDVRSVILPGVSHGMNVQRPALFNRLVGEFLDSL